jgi:hypothetical protein
LKKSNPANSIPELIPNSAFSRIEKWGAGFLAVGSQPFLLQSSLVPHSMSSAVRLAMSLWLPPVCHCGLHPCGAALRAVAAAARRSNCVLHPTHGFQNPRRGLVAEEVEFGRW